MADFKGLRMRAPTRQTNKMLAALGAAPVAMPLPALSEAISKGVVDGYLLPWEVIPSIKAHELTKYESETDPKSRALYTAVFILAMNQAKYDSLPPDLKKVIDANSGRRAVEADGRAVGRVRAARAQARRGPRQHVLRDSGGRARELAEGDGEPARRMGEGRVGEGPTARCCSRRPAT